MQAHILRDAWGLWIVRLLVGLIFLAHGAVRVLGAIHDPRIPEFSRTLAQHGWVPGLLWAWVVTLVEFLGGVGLVLGVAIRLARTGAQAEEIAAACGLARHEADLVVRLHAKDRDARHVALMRA